VACGKLAGRADGDGMLGGGGLEGERREVGAGMLAQVDADAT